MSKETLVRQIMAIVRANGDADRFAQIIIELCALPTEEISGWAISILCISATHVNKKYNEAWRRLAYEHLGDRIRKENNFDFSPKSIRELYNELGPEVRDFHTWAESHAKPIR